MRAHPTLPGLIFDVWRAGRADPAAMRARQSTRLAALVADARQRSPWYRRLYHGLPETIGLDDLPLLPPVTKPELMAHFDDWVTDPAVTRAGVDAFLAAPSCPGERFLDRYALWTTSGTTGTPGIFLHDPDALGVYAALDVVRGWFGWMTPGRLVAVLRAGNRSAFVTAVTPHAAVADAVALMRQHILRRAERGLRAFDVTAPLPALVRDLNAFRPAILSGYTATLDLLAGEQRAGRLHVAPALVVTGAETLAAAARERIGAALGCPVRDSYGASEFLMAAFECAAGRLHVNADWVLLEPVDAAYRPVPPGTPSHTVLLTNLANRVQPILRYDLGDSVTLLPDPCPCGRTLPAIRVEGRAADMLHFQGEHGTRVPIAPLAVASVVEATPGAHRFQVIQTGPATVQVRLEATSGADGDAVWGAVERNLRAYLAAQGAPGVTIERAAEPPARNPRSGKFRHVWAEAARERADNPGGEEGT